MKRVTAILMALIFTIVCALPVNATQPGTDAEEGSTEAQAVYTTEYPDEPARAPDLVSEAAIVMDAKSGAVLYDKNAYIPEYPASITKIITCLLALENLNMADTVTLSNNAVYSIEKGSSSVGLKEGETIGVEDCLKAMMIESANEAACAIAEKVGGSVEQFAQLMNDRAAAIGCRNSHFVNPHGLHNAEHYTCAYDMALFLKEALQYPAFRSLSSMTNAEIPPTSMTDEVRPLWNTLKMIRPGSRYYYEYLEGGKTGYTTDANCTLATYAKKGDMELICIVMNCAGRKGTYSDTKALYEYCFRNFEYYYPLTDYAFSTAGSTDNVILRNYYRSVSDDLLNIGVNRDFCLVLNKAINKDEITTSMTYADGTVSGVLGQLEFSYQGQLLGSTPLTYKTSAQAGTGNTPGTDGDMSDSTQEQTVSQKDDADSSQKHKKQDAGSRQGLPLFVKILLVIIGLFGVYWVYLNYKRYQRRLRRGRRRRRKQSLAYSRRRR